jgi:hypothetical protein
LRREKTTAKDAHGSVRKISAPFLVFEPRWVRKKERERRRMTTGMFQFEYDIYPKHPDDGKK